MSLRQKNPSAEKFPHWEKDAAARITFNSDARAIEAIEGS